jgi:hypothetical protein
MKDGYSNMIYVIRSICRNRILIKTLLWLRGLIAENKIPNSLFNRLINYIPELSENIPDLEAINKYLEYDIRHLNSKEEFVSIHELSKYKGEKKEPPIDARNKGKSSVIKYRSIRIVNYQDILECDSIRDRMFTLDINMVSEDLGYINNFLKQEAYYMGQTYYYTVRLSSLVSRF